MKTKFLLFFSLALLALTKMSAQDSYTQINSLEELTSGEYLIVGDGSANDGFMLNQQNASGNNTYILHSTVTNPGATISEGFTDSNVFTITVEAGQLTIYNASVGYVTYRGTGNHASFYNDTPTDNEKWTFSVTDGLWTLNNVSVADRILQWNNSSPRFAAYTSAQVKLKLYKKDVVEPAVYTIEVTQPTGGSISPEGNIEVEEGEEAEFTATAGPCFVFVNWVVDGENAGNTNPYVFSNVEENHTITAVFEEITYSVTASAGANGTITPNGEIEVACGTDQTFTITADSGYEIADVLVDGESVGAVATYTFTEVDADHTISATFELIEEPGEFCVSEDFELMPTEQGTSYQTRTWTGNDAIEWTATDARTDQSITGRAIGLRASTLTNTNPIEGGVGTISFDYKRIFANNSTLKVFINGTQYGGDITVSDETPATFTAEVNVAGNITVEIVNSGNRTAIDNLSWTCADVEPCFNTITASAGANGTITPNGEVEVNCGEDQTFTITADSGYEIADVLVDGESVGAVATYTFSDVNENHTISTTFELIEEPGEFCVSEDFENMPTEQSTSYQTRIWTGNDGIEWTATDARTDQSITGRAIGLRASTLTNTNPIEGGVGTISFDYKRIFANNSTLKVFINGTQYGGDITVSDETPAIFTAEVNIAGNITVEIVNSGNRTAIDNLAWTCTDVEPCVNTITASADANGTITPTGAVEVNCGDDQTFTVTANAGYEIADVLVDGASVGAVATYTFTEVDADHTISATFELIEEPGEFCVSEDFENIPTEQGTSYQTRTWTGNDAIEWTATDARTDQSITGRAIGLRASTLTNTNPIEGGVGTISFDYKRIFANNSTLKVFINGTQYGGDITVSDETPAIFTAEVNIAGNITVEIVNSGNRTAIDNLSWTCSDVEPCFNTITASAGANGTITPNGEIEVACGTDQTFTITADSGYEIADVLVDGASVGAVATYTFTEVDADHTISVTFEEVVVEEPCFEEGFTNLTEIPTGTTYGEGTYTNNGVTWSFHGQSPLEAGSDASDYSIEGQGILLRRASDSYLEATIPAGVVTFSFEYRKAYTGGNERQLELLVNGTQVATTPVFGAGSGDDPTVYTFSYDLNTTTSTLVRIKLTGETTTNRHATIDNISWTCDGEPCTTPAPVAIGNFEFVAGDTLADLEDSLDYTGELTWYQDEALTIVLPNTTLLEDATLYYVTQTIDGCESDALEVETELLGIDSHAFANFTYYPNPVKNILTLKNSLKVTKVEVYTASGVKVWTKNLQANEAELNLSGLDSGVYILKVSTEKGSKTVKIIKK